MKLKHDEPEYIEAMRLLILGNWNNAKKAFLKLQDSFEGSAFVQLALGNIAYGMGDLNESVDYYKKAIDLKPDFGTAYYKMGVTLYRMGRLQKSLETFEAILKFKDQSHAMANYFIGLINIFLGRDEESVKAFSLLKEDSPESLIANYYMAKPLYAQHKFDEALPLLSELLEEAPQFAEVQFQMGKTLLALHRNFEAIKFYKKALEINPRDNRAKNALELLTDVQWP